MVIVSRFVLLVSISCLAIMFLLLFSHMIRSTLDMWGEGFKFHTMLSILSM